jgi:hypothetical protein
MCVRIPCIKDKMVMVMMMMMMIIVIIIIIIIASPIIREILLKRTHIGELRNDVYCSVYYLFSSTVGTLFASC